MAKIFIFLIPLLLVHGVTEAAVDGPIPGINLELGSSSEPEEVATSIKLIILLTVLSVAPAILLLTTSFARIVIVLSFVRTSLGTQQMPPNQVIIGLALFLTMFIMGPIFSEMNQKAFQPFIEGEISQEQAFEAASMPLKEFMAKHTREKDLNLFLTYTNQEKPETIQDIPLNVLIPAFAISELKTAFQMGFMIFLPFLIIDMVVASVLMAMGMMMLPPVMISLPFKILLFILVDGWHLIVKSLLISF